MVRCNRLQLPTSLLVYTYVSILQYFSFLSFFLSYFTCLYCVCPPFLKTVFFLSWITCNVMHIYFVFQTMYLVYVYWNKLCSVLFLKKFGAWSWLYSRKSILALIAPVLSVKSVGNVLHEHKDSVCTGDTDIGTTQGWNIWCILPTLFPVKRDFGVLPILWSRG